MMALAYCLHGCKCVKGREAIVEWCNAKLLPDKGQLANLDEQQSADAGQSQSQAMELEESILCLCQLQ